MTFPAGAGGMQQGPWAVTGTDGSLPSLANMTQSNVTDQLKGQLTSSPNWSNLGTMFQGVVKGSGLELMSQFVSTVAHIDINILGFDVEPFAFLQSWADDLASQGQQALTNATNAQAGVSTISTGVSSNITGATTGSAATSVGPAVGVLNTTVQTAAQAPNVQVFNASGTWTMPAGAKTIEVLLIGGGGGGARGGSFGQSGSSGGGGGAGGYSTFSLQASGLSSTQTVTTGTAGAGATADQTAGGAGTGSAFGTYSCGGGGGGQPVTSSSTVATPALNGQQGAGNSPYINPTGGLGANDDSGAYTNGTAGGNGINSQGGAVGASGHLAGYPGAAPAGVVYGPGSGGGGGAWFTTGTAGTGGAGGFPGGGGGGGGSYVNGGFNGNGGAGAAGQVVVITHFS